MKSEPQDEYFSTIRSPEGEFVSKLSPQPQHSFSITKEATRLMQKDHQPTATDDRVKEQGSHAAQEWTRETVYAMWNTLHYDDDFKPTNRFVDKLIDAHKAALAAKEEWWSLCLAEANELMNQELKAEREKRRKKVDELVHLLQRAERELLSAQAAIAEHNAYNGDLCPLKADFSTLEKHVAEKTKPLVDLLEWIDRELKGPQFPSERQIQRRIADALAKFK